MIFKDSYDVIIVGAGPAGTSTARACAEKGLDVLVLEKRDEIGSPKRCGEGLSMRNDKELGLNIPRKCISAEIDGAYVYAPNKKKVEILSDRTKGFILERKVFDKWMAERAAKAGAKIISKAVVTDFTNDNGISVRVKYFDEEISLKCKIIVAADGVESFIVRKAGIIKSKNPKLVDSGFQYEMTNIDINPKMIEFFVGTNIAPRGYTWIFPKGENTANVGVGVSGMDANSAKSYLDKFIESRPELKKGSIIEVNAGCVPVGGLLKNMVADGIVGVGDSVNQVNPIHGGGIAESIAAGMIAGEVIKNAFERNDFSSSSLSEYNGKWWKERGEKLAKIEKVREAFENMNDENLNNLSDVLDGEDLTDMAKGKNLVKISKIMIKYKMKNLASRLGL